MRKPCSSCQSIVVVNGKSLSNPQCHACRAKARTTLCERCGKVMTATKRSSIRKFCSSDCANKARCLDEIKRCEWCDKTFILNPDRRSRNVATCSYRCTANLKMPATCAWTAPKVRVAMVKPVKVYLCKGCSTPVGSKTFKCDPCMLLHPELVRKRKRLNNHLYRKKMGETHRKRARKYGCEYEPVNRLKVFARDQYICHICGVKTDPNLVTNSKHYPTIDHIIPMSKQGGHLYSNIATACFMCNSVKRDLDLDTARLLLT